MSPQDLTEAQRAIAATVAEWPEARSKGVFGHEGFVRNGKMFGFLAGEGLAVKVRAGTEADGIYAREGVHAFSYNAMEMRAWAVLPLRDDAEAEFALTALQAAYDTAHAT